MLLFLIGCFQIEEDAWTAWEEKNAKPAEEVAENLAPVVSGVTISPNDTIYNDAELSCAATAEDPEGEEVTLSYEWQNNGARFATGQTVDLGGQNIFPHQEISCVVTAEDPQGITGAEEASVIIANRAPEITSVVISDELPEANASLTCEAQVSDADGEEVNLEYTWTIDEQEEGFSSALTLLPEDTPVGAVVRCSVMASDSSDVEIIDYKEAIVQNTPPQIDTEAEITVTGTITTISTLSCFAEGSDLNDGELEVAYVWRNVDTGIDIGTGRLLHLDPELVSPDDIVKCTARVQDAQGEIDTSVAVVSVNNAPPSFTQPAEITPNTGVVTGSSLTCFALGEDPEQGNLLPSYNWEANGSNIGSGSSITLDASVTNVGDQISCIAEITDSDGEEDASIAYVTIENTAPTINSIVLSPAAPEVEDLVACVVDITDPDEETLTIAYSWELAGNSIGTNSPTLQLTPSTATIGEQLSCAVSVLDPAGDVASASISETLQNTPPTVTQPVITPNTVVTTISTLNCSATGNDVNDGALQPTFVWMNGLIQIGTGPSITLDPSLALPNDTVDCVATVTDNDDISADSTASVLVGNALPIFTQPAQISPNTSVYTGTELTCAAVVNDAEDGNINPSFVWEVEGVQVKTGPTYTILASDSDVGNSVVCIATVEDFHGGVRNSVSTVIIENSNPIISNLSISNQSSTEIYNDDIVSCSGNIYDPDLDQTTPTARWSSGGVEYGTGPFFDMSTTPLLPGDVLICHVEVTDTNSGLTQAQTSVTLGNRPPTAPTVSISWGSGHYYPWPNEDLTCTGSGSGPEDADGETVSYLYEWNSDAGGSFTGQILPAPETTEHELWTCIATATDGSLSESSEASTLVRNCSLTDCDIGLNLGGAQAFNFNLITDLDMPSTVFSVSSTYYIMTTEVTQGMFSQLMGYESHGGEELVNGDGSYGVGDEHPAYYLNWHMAADLANHATNRHNFIHGTSLSQCYSCLNSGSKSVSCSDAMNPYSCDGYRLPTEIEWDIASRAGVLAHFWTPAGGGTNSANNCNGGAFIDDGSFPPPLIVEYAWYCGNNAQGGHPYGSKEVAQLLPNAWGLYDMHGNISEWVADWEGCSYPNMSVDGYCDTSHVNKISRGGVWIAPPDAITSSHRGGYDLNERTRFMGVRLVRNP